MSNAKHTPGPWPIKHISGGQFKYCPRFHVGPAIINYSAGYHSAEQDAEFLATAEANARLISSAIKVLEALKMYVNAGFGNSTDCAKQAEAYDAAIEAMGQDFP